MSNLTQFNFKSNQVRVEIKDDQPFFCLKDITDILEIKNSRDLLAKQLKPKGVEKIYTHTNGGKQQVVFIDEPNLYRVIFRSNKKEAVEFQDWVFEEVLPTIRKTGEYSAFINESQKATILELVNQRVKRTGETHQAIYRKIHNAFGVSSYTKLLANQFDEVVEFVTGMKAIPQQMLTDKIMIDTEIAEVVLKYINMSRRFARNTEQTHRELFDILGMTRLSGVKNDIAATAYDLSHEFNYWLDEFANQVRPRLACNF